MIYRPPQNPPDATSETLTVTGNHKDALALAREVAKRDVFNGMSKQFKIVPNGTGQYRVTVEGWYDIPY